VHALHRFLERVGASLPPATVILDFPVGATAQVDFGKGPLITDRRSGELIASWIFVMTLAWSRHQYAEIVRNQKVETWLACHRHAFEWCKGVTLKIAIDNPKCAITRGVLLRTHGAARLWRPRPRIQFPHRRVSAAAARIEGAGRIGREIRLSPTSYRYASSPASTTPTINSTRGSWAKPAIASTAPPAHDH
jgi:transposase